MTDLRECSILILNELDNRKNEIFEIGYREFRANIYFPHVSPICDVKVTVLKGFPGSENIEEDATFCALVEKKSEKEFFISKIGEFYPNPRDVHK